MKSKNREAEGSNNQRCKEALKYELIKLGTDETEMEKMTYIRRKV